jgi:hypothetical protein
MIAEPQVNRTVLAQLIERLPPGRARKRYEELLIQSTAAGAVPLGGVLCTGRSEPEPWNPESASPKMSAQSKLPRYTLIVETSRKVVPPISIEPWISVLDPDRFIEAIIQELVAYVAAKNMAHGIGWKIC